MKPSIRFVAVDLDGTVLVEHVGLSQRTKSAFVALKSRGIVPLIATGRPRRSSLPWAAALDVDSGMVCHNGAMIYDAEARIIGETTISEEAGRLLIKVARKIPVHFHGFVADEWLFETPRPGTIRYETRSSIKGQRVDFDSLPRLGFHKAMFVGSEEEAPGIAALLRESLGDSVEVYATGSGFVEVVAPGISKGKSLAILLASLGGKMEELIAFGDAWNDEDMLLAAGIGVAMGNAPAELRKRIGRVAEAVTEDGVALWLEDYFKLAS